MVWGVWKSKERPKAEELLWKNLARGVDLRLIWFFLGSGQSFKFDVDIYVRSASTVKVATCSNASRFHMILS